MRSHLCLGTAFEGIDADFVGTQDAFEEDRMRRSSFFHVYRFHDFHSSLLRGTSLRLVVSFPFVGLSRKAEVLERIGIFSTVEFTVGLDFYSQVDGLSDLEVGKIVGVSELGHLLDGSFVFVVAHHALYILCFLSALALGKQLAFG